MATRHATTRLQHRTCPVTAARATARPLRCYAIVPLRWAFAPPFANRPSAPLRCCRCDCCHIA
eukprot:5070790-Lingulodinium_polyedra.AAC.1